MIDLIVRHGGLSLVAAQIRVEGNSDIKKAALQLLVRFLTPKSRSLKEMVQDEVKRQKIVSYCAS